jgi:hypothetical protein
MTQFDEASVDASAFQPPSKWQARSSNLMVWLTVALLLVAGWFLKDWMMTQFRYLALAEGEPAIPYPAQWQPQPAQGLALQVFAPDSDSPFASREEVAVLPLPDAPIASAWPEQRQEQLRDYQESDRALVTMDDGRQALLLTYTYVAEGDAPASLIVVSARDMAFQVNDGHADRLVVVTLAADADEREKTEPVFQRLLQQMGVTAR